MGSLKFISFYLESEQSGLNGQIYKNFKIPAKTIVWFSSQRDDMFIEKLVFKT